MYHLEEYASLDRREQRLLTVMGLALVDGVFLGLIISGTIDSITTAIQFGILLFSGSATAAVIVSSFDDKSLNEQVVSIIKVSIIILLAAVLEAILAPTLEELLKTNRLKIFAGIALLVIAIEIADTNLSSYIPSPIHVMGVGLIVSLNIKGLSTFTVVYKVSVIKYAVVAVSSGIVVSIGLAVVLSVIEDSISMRKLRLGSSLALTLLALVVIGILPGTVPLAAFGLVGLLSIRR